MVCNLLAQPDWSKGSELNSLPLAVLSHKEKMAKIYRLLSHFQLKQQRCCTI